MEQLGHTALTSSWTVAVRGSGGLVRWAARRLAAACRWFVEGTPRQRLVSLLALVGAGIAAFVLVRDHVPLVDDREALARVIHSECGRCSGQQKLHIAWATRNLAQFRNQGIAAMVCAPCGPQQRGRPVSSKLGANDSDRRLAEYVLGAPPMADPTGGATHFVNPRLQDQLARTSDRPGYRGKPYSAVRRRWIETYGWEPYYRLAPDLELWGPRR